MSESPILPYAVPVKPVNTAGDIARRALLWTILCSISAGPSFFWANKTFDRLAMISGIALFIVLYTVSTSTKAFLRFRELRHVRRTLYIGYITRIAVSIVFPLGMVIDLFPGLLSIGIVSQIMGNASMNGASFIPTLAITIIQGTILNILLSIFMLMVWAIQLAFIRPRSEMRGFPVDVRSTETPS